MEACARWEKMPAWLMPKETHHCVERERIAGIPRLYRSEIPAVGREAVESEADAQNKPNYLPEGHIQGLWGLVQHR